MSNQNPTTMESSKIIGYRFFDTYVYALLENGKTVIIGNTSLLPYLDIMIGKTVRYTKKVKVNINDSDKYQVEAIVW